MPQNKHPNQAADLVNSMALARFFAIGMPWLKPTPVPSNSDPPATLALGTRAFSCTDHLMRALFFAQGPKSNVPSLICADEPALVRVNDCIITECACAARAW